VRLNQSTDIISTDRYRLSSCENVVKTQESDRSFCYICGPGCYDQNLGPSDSHSHAMFPA